MSLKDSFVRAWKNKFSGQEPPELDCLDQTEDDVLDVKAIEKSLQKCNNTIAQLNKQLQETEFMASFLWDLLHGVNKVMPSPVPAQKQIRRERDPLISELDNAIPIQGSFDSSNSSPTDDPSAHYLQSIRNSSSGHRNVASERAFSSFKPLEEQIPQKCPKGGIDKRSNSVDLDSLEPQRERRISNHYYSVVPKSFDELEVPSRTHTPEVSARPMKPVPTPRVSIASVQSKPPDNNLPVKPHRNASKPLTQKPFSSTESSSNSYFFKKKAPPSLPGEKQVSSEPPTKHKFFSSWDRKKSIKDGASVKVDAEAKELQKSPQNSNLYSLESGARVDDAKNDSVETSNKKDRKRHDYEEVVPVNKKTSDEACVSTDEDEEGEDEPLYFNILLIQDRAKNKMQTWYAKGGTQKLHESRALERDAAVPKRKPVARELPNWTKESILSSDSVRSGGSDSVFEDKTSFKDNRSPLRSADSLDSQSDADDLSDMAAEEDGKLQMRKWVVKSILESENSFLCVLDVLMKHMTTFKNVLGTPQVVITASDIETIFHKIPEIHHAHKMFVYQLTPKLENWSPEQQIGDIFKTLADEENIIAPVFIKNYPKAVQTVRKCWAENPQFALLTKQIKVKNNNETPSIEELIHKPVLRFQRNSLVLHDLIKCTPPGHADYDTLQKTLQLSRLFLENLESPVDGNKVDHQRYLAKQGMVVEQVKNMRKLRHIFLFNDVLVCARQKISSSRQKINFEPKWHISLLELSLDDIVCLEEEKILAEAQQSEIESLQKKMSDLQKELRSELKVSLRESSECQSKQWSFHSRTNKNLEKVKKKMVENQAALIKASPCLTFKIHDRRLGRIHTLLMASDYERANWRTTICGLLSRAQTSQNFSTAELQSMLNSQKISMSKMLGGLVNVEDLDINEEHLFGLLNIKIFKLQGLKVPGDYYCTVEVDTFNQFFLKARTKVVADAVEPCWDEGFEIELEGSQTLRILCYKVVKDVGTLVGTCALELSKAWLRGDFQEKPISINDELSLTISLMYCSRDQTIKRKQSSVKGGIFGAPLKSVAKREGSNIPLIVKTCVQEVENRGLKELGIYRVSGVSGDIQKLKRLFERSSKVAATMVSDFDIHVVTGTLKTYFRELPEALFTDSLYPQFIKGFGLADPEAKEACINSLLDSLPDPNKSTVEYLLNHLIRISTFEQDNRMTLQNLATVFGPTLLRPAIKEAQPQTLEELFSSGTREVMVQTNILFYFLSITAKSVHASQC